MKTRTKQEKIDLLLPILCSMIYVSSYLGRHSYNSNIAQIVEALGASYTETGTVTTFFFFAYGAGQFVHGLLCSRYNEKIVILLALGVSSLMNILIFAGVDFSVYKYLWLINGMFLSMLWPTLLRVLSKYLSGGALSRGMVAIGASATIGYCLAYLTSSIFTAIGVYKLSFLFAAAMMIALASVWIFSYYRLGLNTAGVVIDSEKAKKPSRPANTAAAKDGKYALAFVLISLGIYAIIGNTIKEGLHVWVPSVLRDKFDIPGSMSTLLSLTLSIFGLFASILSVKLNKLIKNYLLEIELIFIAAVVLVGSITGLLGTEHLVLTLICLGMTSLLMHTSCCVITSLAPLELRERMDSGVLAGILNGCCYIGSTISSYALGSIADIYGWSAVFYFLLMLTCVPVSVLLIKCCVRAARKVLGH